MRNRTKRELVHLWSAGERGRAFISPPAAPQGFATGADTWGMSDSRRSPFPSELKRTESLMQREAYERAGAQARSLGVPRHKNPFVRVLAHDAERERLGVLAEHWWRGWDQWTPPPPRHLPPSHRAT